MKKKNPAKIYWNRPYFLHKKIIGNPTPCFLSSSHLPTCKLCEDLLEGLPADVGQHVEPAPVRHAHDHGLHPVQGGPVHDGLHARDHHLHTLQAEALLGRPLLGQEVLEAGGPTIDCFFLRSCLFLPIRRFRNLDILESSRLLSALLSWRVPGVSSRSLIQFTLPWREIKKGKNINADSQPTDVFLTTWTTWGRLLVSKMINE